MKRYRRSMATGWVEGNRISIWLYTELGQVGLEMIYWARKTTAHSIRKRVPPKVAREIAEELLRLADKAEKERVEFCAHCNTPLTKHEAEDGPFCTVCDDLEDE